MTGRKLFICFSPEDTEHLYQMESEVETSQSPIDVLAPDHEKVQGISVVLSSLH